MKLSQLFKLNALDFLKGLLLAVLSSVLTVIYDTVNTGSLDFNSQKLLLVAIASASGYILNRFISNSNGQLLKSDDIGGGIKNPNPKP